MKDWKQLIGEARKRNIPNVVFIPSQPKESMPQYWSLCNVALVHLKDTPVLETVIPSKIFEAMGMGLPVLLASPTGEARQIVEREGAGIWVPPEDPEALRDGILKLKNDSSFYSACAVNSRSSAPRYSRERQAQEMLRVIWQVVNGNSMPSDVRESG